MELVYPMFAMVILTTFVAFFTAYVRIKGAYSGDVHPKYFKLMSNYDVPEKMAQLGRNLNNLFEVPMLFYTVCILAIALNVSSVTLLMFAWVFVGARVVHTAIHITYNHPLHRFFPFALSLFCVVVMWMNVVLAVSRSF